MQPRAKLSMERLAVVERLVARLAAKDYAGVLRLAPGSRVTAQQIEAAIKQYGRTLLPLPPDARALVDFVAIHNSSLPAWSVVVPLFTKEEGRSDLSLELSMVKGEGGAYEVEVDDLHVL